MPNKDTKPVPEWVKQLKEGGTPTPKHLQEKWDRNAAEELEARKQK